MFFPFPLEEFQEFDAFFWDSSFGGSRHCDLLIRGKGGLTGEFGKYSKVEFLGISCDVLQCY